MSETIGVLWLLAFVYILVTVVMGIVALCDDKEPERMWLAPAWPLFWIKFVWNRLRE